MFVRFSTFCAVALSVVWLASCRPEPVPIVATYEPVDCSCPESPSGPTSEEQPDPSSPRALLEEEPQDDDPSVQLSAGSVELERHESGTLAAVEEGRPEDQERELEPPPALDPRVDLNTASEAELRTLPRIGPSKAQRILDYRAKRPFRRTKDVMRIKGIGPATYQKLEDKIVVRRGGSEK